MKIKLTESNHINYEAEVAEDSALLKKCAINTFDSLLQLLANATLKETDYAKPYEGEHPDTGLKYAEEEVYNVVEKYVCNGDDLAKLAVIYALGYTEEAFNKLDFIFQDLACNVLDEVYDYWDLRLGE